MYYVSVESADPLLPAECIVEQELVDPTRPNLRCAVLRLRQSTRFLPARIVVAPKSGFDVTPRDTEDAALVYAFEPPPDLNSRHFSLTDLWNSGVKDWGAITITREKASELKPEDET